MRVAQPASIPSPSTPAIRVVRTRFLIAWVLQLILWGKHASVRLWYGDPLDGVRQLSHGFNELPDAGFNLRAHAHNMHPKLALCHPLHYCRFNFYRDGLVRYIHSEHEAHAGFERLRLKGLYLPAID